MKPVNRALSISVQQADFSVDAEYQLLRQIAGNAGAIAIFTGLVREFYETAPAPSGRTDPVISLTLEHYPGMTEKALQEIVDKAAARWKVQACRVIHRVGTLQAGEQIVFVGAASAHRSDALAATQFIMDYLKTSAPFWKKQESAAGSMWIESRDSDQQALKRW